MECASACVPIARFERLLFFSPNMVMSLISTDLTDIVERALACGHKHMESIQVRTDRVVR